MFSNLTLGFCVWDIPAFLILLLLLIMILVHQHNHKKRMQKYQEDLDKIPESKTRKDGTAQS